MLLSRTRNTVSQFESIPMTPPIMEHEHDRASVAHRLAHKPQSSMLGDFVLGSIDGTITTFAIVSGVAGAELTVSIAIILGFANVLADGFSMAVSGYLKARSDVQTLEQYRAIEVSHIQHCPEGEREEIRQIYAQKGFSGELLEDIVDTITADEDRWIETMLVDEYGFTLDPASPIRAATVTFVSFVVVGCVPIFPLMFSSMLTANQTFALSAGATALTFVAIGAIRGHVLKSSMVRNAIETLIIGAAAATLAYVAGAFLKNIVGVG